MPKGLAQIDKGFCFFPFMHIAVRPTNYINPCCRFIPHLCKQILNEDNNLTSIFNGQYYNNLRHDMMTGKQVEGCHVCRVEENTGVESMRTKMLSREYTIDKPIIKYLEIGLSNMCNLKCRTCSALLSTAWAEDEKALQSYPQFNRTYTTNKMNVNLDYIDENSLKHIEMLKIVGGEPFFDTNIENFLRMIPYDVRGNCKLDLYTNCTIMPNENLMKLLNSFNEIVLHLSIDAYGERNDYIRKNSVWKIVESNAKKWVSIQNEKFTVNLATTVSAYNVLYLNEIIEWWGDLTDYTNTHEIQIVKSPLYVSPLAMTDEVLREAVNKLKPLIDSGKYQISNKILVYLNNSQTNGLHDLFLKYTRVLDRIRNDTV